MAGFAARTGIPVESVPEAWFGAPTQRPTGAASICIFSQGAHVRLENRAGLFAYLGRPKAEGGWGIEYVNMVDENTSSCVILTSIMNFALSHHPTQPAVGLFGQWPMVNKGRLLILRLVPHQLAPSSKGIGGALRSFACCEIADSLSSFAQTETAYRAIALHDSHRTAADQPLRRRCRFVD